jgi:hypothetical protein
MPASRSQVKDYTCVFETFGVSFGSVSGDNALAETCPWCGKDRFYLNVTTGQYDCKKCQAQGNITTYLTWLHRHFLDKTTNEHYLQLKAKRGIASQTLKLHELAYDVQRDRWLIPFKNPQGNVINLQLYYPAKEKPNKYMLPGLPTSIYGFDKLMTTGADVPVLLFEGPFDAIAADWNIEAKHRSRYCILATPGHFKKEWAEHFRGRKVRVLNDNDNGGREQSKTVEKLLGESRVAAELQTLRWPDGYPDGYDINNLVCEHPEVKVVGWAVKNSFRYIPEGRLDWEDGWSRKNTGPEVIEWVWPNRMRTRTYVSLSGFRGTLKSTLVREIVARYTRGELLPACESVGMPAGHVIYITAEDGKDTAWAHFERLGADLGRISVHSAILKDGEMLNVLEHLDEFRQKIRELGTRLVVIDGQNSVVGAPNISTDMLARHNITNKLHQFAQRENICLLGVRNEDPTGRAYGPASMGDLSRCILRVEELKPLHGERYFALTFERISDAAPGTHPPLPYSVEDLGGSSRRILWGITSPEEEEVPPVGTVREEVIKAAFKAKPSRNGDGHGAAGENRPSETVPRG